LSVVDANKLINGDLPDHYGCFTKMNPGIIESLQEAYYDIPMVFEDELHTAFIANFPNTSITAPIHSAALVNSIGIQFVGKKTWLIFPRRWLDDFNALASFAINLPGSAPKVDEIEYWHYVQELVTLW